MPILEVLFYPIVLTTIIIGIIIARLRRRKKSKKVSPLSNSPPMESGENQKYEDYNSDFPLGI